ncbi:ESPR-type extended signal peptide-containing protein [Cupriavidus numazuensis]|uniref:Uncharacterized protein n=1 Tax=Cupriavidus numazuensis TaxID=221992 RepID=A0ABN7Q4K3_9BURK|nr:YadA-like family protein [Cupriavidus numazuensis]CAG2156840.1 hypothetical protein LMG26411_05385 [Cupriavidus numazuensis]
MNRIYRLIWNAAQNAWSVASETARAHGKRSTRVSRSARLAKPLLVGTLALSGVFVAPAAFAQWSNASGNATGAGSIAVGGGSGATANANTPGSIAIGDDATATSKKNGSPLPTGATAIGHGATATTQYGGGPVAIGTAATAVVSAGNGGSPVAIGTTSNANGAGSQVAIGDQARANGMDAIAIGGHANSAGVIATGDQSTAIGQSSTATGTGSVSIGYSTKSSGIGSIALGGDGVNGSTASGNSAFAVGAGANASANDSIALSENSKASAAGAVAIGANSNAIGTNSAALGYGTVARGNQSVAFGVNANSVADDSVAVGSGSTASRAGMNGAKELFSNAAVTSNKGAVSVGGASNERQITNVAGGTQATDAVNVRQLQAVSDGSVKYDKNPDGSVNYNSVTMGGDTYNSTTKTGGTKITNVARGENPSDAVNMSQITDIAGDTSDTYITNNGRGVKYVRTNDTGLTPDDAHASAQGATAVGYNAQASATNALALGNQAQASYAGSVALGAGSIANGATLGNQAYMVGGSATGEVNIGNRRITGVSAGAMDTDAVNVSQLKSVADSAVQYDKNPDGTVNYNSVTMNGDTYNTVTKTGGTRVRNVAAGVDGGDAVNVDQLNQSITNVNNTITDIAGDTGDTYITNNGRGVKYVRTNDTGLTEDDAHASAQGATAVGYNAQASAANALALGYQSQATAAGSVALGAGSIANGATLGNQAYMVGGTAAGEVSVGSAGNERRVTNVAAGSSDTDAVNVSQLKAVNTQVGDLDKGAVKYDKNPDGSVNYNSVTMGGDTYNSTTKTGGTTISNVAYGVNDSDAVNLQQLKEMTVSISDNTVNKMDAATRYFQANGSNTDADKAVASGAGSTAMGPSANASGTNSVAMGNGAKATADSSVAIGANSVADRPNAVSVGAVGNERQITNVAAGTAQTDAVNVSQLQSSNAQTLNLANGYTDSKIGGVRNDANAGAASAMAMAGLPQAVIPGKGLVGLAGSTYAGQSAMALGMSALSDSGRWVYKAAASTNTRGEYGVTVGAGFHW